MIPHGIDTLLLSTFVLLNGELQVLQLCLLFLADSCIQAFLRGQQHWDQPVT